MPVADEVAAISSRASALLDALNDAIERALKSETKLYYSSSRRSPTTPLEQGSLTASSEAPGDYAYMPGGDSYVMPSRGPTYQTLASSGDAYRPYASSPNRALGGNGIGRGEVKGEARILSEVRESLAQVEEHLYNVQELEEHQEEEKAALIRKVDQKREQLVELLKEYRGQEWEVVQEIMQFCGGGAPPPPPPQPVAGNPPARQVYNRALVSPFASTQPTPYQPAIDEAREDAGEVSDDEQEDELLRPARPGQGELQRRGGSGYDGGNWMGAQRRLVEDWEMDEEEEQEEEEEEEASGDAFGSEDELPRGGPQMPVPRHELERVEDSKWSPASTETEDRDGQGGDGEEAAEGSRESDGHSAVTEEETQSRAEGGQGDKGGLGGLVLGLPAKALEALGDAAGHVASVTVKLAIISLGVAAILSIGEGVKRRQTPAAVQPNRRAAAPVPTPVAGQHRRAQPSVEQKPQPSSGRPHTCSPAHEVRHAIFNEGGFPQCTIRERMERKGLGETGGGKDVFLARG